MASKLNTPGKLKLLIVFMWVFGVVPMNLPIINRKEKIIYTLLHIQWQIIILSTLAWCMITFDLNNTYDVLTVISEMLSIVEFFFNFVITLLIMVGCYYQKQSYQKYYSQVCAIDVQLNMFGGNANFTKITPFLLKNIFFFGSLLVIDIIITCLFPLEMFDMIQFIIIYFVPGITIFLAFLQYWLMLHLIGERFNHIKVILIKLRDVNECDTKESQIIIEETIESMANVFNDLSRMHEDVAQSFGLLITIHMASTLITSITQLYFLYTFTYELDLDVIEFLDAICYLIINISNLFYVLLLNSNVREQVCTTQFIYLLHCYI